MAESLVADLLSSVECRCCRVKILDYDISKAFLCLGAGSFALATVFA